MTNFIGSIYADNIAMSDNDDFVFGFSGNDTIQDNYGIASNDVMYGGNGMDTFTSRHGMDAMYGEKGRDIFQFYSHTFNLVIDGGAGNDTLKVSAALFAPGETELLQKYADDGALFQLAGGGVVHIKDVEVIMLL